MVRVHGGADRVGETKAVRMDVCVHTHYVQNFKKFQFDRIV